MADIVQYINYAIAIIFFLCYSYQFVYIVISFFTKPKVYEDTGERKRFAFLLAARNEETVIGNLIDSILKQDYPADLIDIYVCADNSDDKTAQIARDLGCHVYERHDMNKVGKGYALDFLLDRINETVGDSYYDGYFVFDADNLLDKNYVFEMNKAMCSGYKILTSYRNSKNFGRNWITSGYALWFLREARYLNNVRTTLGTSCAVSGTGFLVSSEIMRRNNGWKFFLLTEDIEFTINSVIQGERIGYCDAARYYDEQPVTFKASWDQRLRWAKGYFQVFANYGGKLFKGIFGNNGWSCYDMTMNIMPACILSMLSVIINVGTMIWAAVTGADISGVLWSVLAGSLGIYGIMFLIGTLACITEWKEIRCSKWGKVLYCFTFPLFMFTFLPIAAVALFTKVEWKPIKHEEQISIDDMDQDK